MLCRNSPLEIVTPSTAARIRPHTPPVMIEACPAYPVSAAGPLGVPAREASSVVQSRVSPTDVASRP